MELSKNETILSVENLHFSYSSNRDEVLRGVNCDIKKGERVAILGSNGAGKSTFFSLITGILNGYTGSIKLNGQEKLSTGLQSNDGVIHGMSFLL